MGSIKHIIWSLYLLGVLSSSNTMAQKPSSFPIDKLPVISVGGSNLKDIKRIGANHIEATLIDSSNPDFIYTFSNLPTTEESTITIYLEKKGSRTPGKLAHWPGQNPVMTYGDPGMPQTYVGYHRDDDDSLWSPITYPSIYLIRSDKGKSPRQAKLPDEAGLQFLNNGGSEQIWSPWRYVDNIELDPAQGCFRIKQQFRLPQATVSMKIPSFEVNVSMQSAVTSVPIIDQKSHMTVLLSGTPRDASCWNIGTLNYVSTDKETILNLVFTGDPKSRAANYDAWRQIWPIFTYADPSVSGTFQWYRRLTDSLWVNGETNEPVGRGNVPVQTSIPQKYETEFLATDKKYWFPWREVDNIEMIPDEYSFRLRQKFSESTVSLHMGITLGKVIQELSIADTKLRFPTKEILTTANTLAWYPMRASILRAVRPEVISESNDSFNINIGERIDAHRLIMEFTNPCHNFWAMRLSHLPTDVPMQIGFNMDSNDTRNKADVKKWIGLRPMLTYSDPNRYESYEWYLKDTTGRWVSGDIFKDLKTRYAGTGKVPTQKAVPDELSEECLSIDGKVWVPWHDIDATVEPNLNIMRYSYLFRQSTASVAMRIPFTSTYQTQVIDRLRTAKYPGVFVDDIGSTKERRRLYVIRVQSPNPEEVKKTKPTIIIYAREHAPEQDGSFVILGALKWLLSNSDEAIKARNAANWLLIPMMRPDESSNVLFDVGDLFAGIRPVSREATFFAQYLINWVDSGNTVDMVINLHNVECNEGPNIFCPFMNYKLEKTVKEYNNSVLAQAKLDGFTVGNDSGSTHGSMPFRMHGWCNSMFGSTDISFEVNTRSPGSPLSLPRTYALGETLARQTWRFIGSPSFSSVSENVKAGLAAREVSRKDWNESQKGELHRGHTSFEIFALGI